MCCKSFFIVSPFNQLLLHTSRMAVLEPARRQDRCACTLISMPVNNSAVWPVLQSSAREEEEKETRGVEMDRETGRKPKGKRDVEDECK